MELELEGFGAYRLAIPRQALPFTFGGVFFRSRLSRESGKLWKILQ